MGSKGDGTTSQRVDQYGGHSANSSHILGLTFLSSALYLVSLVSFLPQKPAINSVDLAKKIELSQEAVFITSPLLHPPGKVPHIPLRKVIKVLFPDGKTPKCGAEEQAAVAVEYASARWW
jgi:hypothetical protein